MMIHIKGIVNKVWRTGHGTDLAQLTPISKYRLKTDFDVIKSVEKTRHIVGFNNVIIEKRR